MCIRAVWYRATRFVPHYAVLLGTNAGAGTSGAMMEFYKAYAPQSKEGAAWYKPRFLLRGPYAMSGTALLR